MINIMSLKQYYDPIEEHCHDPTQKQCYQVKRHHEKHEQLEQHDALTLPPTLDVFPGSPSDISLLSSSLIMLLT